MVLAKRGTIAAATTGSAASQEGRVRMLIQLFVGSAVRALNIVLHTSVTIIAMGAARSAARRSSFRPLLYLAGVMIATSLALTAAHTLEVFV
jgi:hypothetical protein